MIQGSYTVSSGRVSQISHISHGPRSCAGPLMMVPQNNHCSLKTEVRGKWSDLQHRQGLLMGHQMGPLAVQQLLPQTQTRQANLSSSKRDQLRRMSRGQPHRMAPMQPRTRLPQPPTSSWVSPSPQLYPRGQTTPLQWSTCSSSFSPLSRCSSSCSNRLSQVGPTHTKRLTLAEECQ